MPDHPSNSNPLGIGTWVRTGGLIGLVAAVREGQVTVFNPGDRQTATVAATDVEQVPAGAVTVHATVDLPLAHGLDERALRRWVASLLDDVLRERAAGVLTDAELDEGAALPSVTLEVRPAAGDAALCLCGHRTVSDEPSTTCPSCGRQAVKPPPPRGGLPDAG